MSTVRINLKDNIDEAVGIHYSLISSVKNTIDEHDHDFFEIFLVFGGSALHYVNGASQNLNEGSLVFIRPDDVHFYERDHEADCQIINIAFSRHDCTKLFEYLDNPALYELLMKPKYPVYIELPHNEMFSFISKFQKLYTLLHYDKKAIRAELKKMIMDLVSCFQYKLGHDEADTIPSWLESLIYKMQYKENFTAGLPKMLELAAKTHEHLCRELKKFYGKTPTEYINELRLNYAKNLLCSTDINITDICYESGFENLSHFYHLFKSRFGASPAVYRKRNRRVII